MKFGPEGVGSKIGGGSQGIGQSRGGPCSKVVASVDTPGYLVRFVILPGQAHDLAGVLPMLEDLPFDTLIGDRAFDADRLLAELETRGAQAVIPSRKNRKEPREHDREMYCRRCRIDNLFAKIKEFRAIATRCGKTEESFAAAIRLAAGIVAAR